MEMWQSEHEDGDLANACSYPVLICWMESIPVSVCHASGIFWHAPSSRSSHLAQRGHLVPEGRNVRDSTVVESVELSRRWSQEKWQLKDCKSCSVSISETRFRCFQSSLTSVLCPLLSFLPVPPTQQAPMSRGRCDNESDDDTTRCVSEEEGFDWFPLFEHNSRGWRGSRDRRKSVAEGNERVSLTFRCIRLHLNRRHGSIGATTSSGSSVLSFLVNVRVFAHPFIPFLLIGMR